MGGVISLSVITWSLASPKIAAGGDERLTTYLAPRWRALLR